MPNENANDDVHYVGSWLSRRGRTACGLEVWSTGLVIEDKPVENERRIRYADTFTKVTCPACAARSPFRLRTRPLR